MTTRRLIWMILGAVVLVTAGLFAPIQEGIPLPYGDTCFVTTGKTATAINPSASKRHDNNTKMRVILNEADIDTRRSIVTALTRQTPRPSFTPLAGNDGSGVEHFKALVKKSWVSSLSSYFRRDGICQAGLVFTDGVYEWVITLQLDRLMADPKRWLLPE